MRRAPAWLAVLGIVLAWPAATQAASVWVTFAAGLPGGAAPSATSEFFFTNPQAPNVAVTELTGGVSAEATTGGGSSFFGGAGIPVLLSLADGSAFIANGSAPPSAKLLGAAAGPTSSTAPIAGGSVPSNAALLGINLAESNNGSRLLSANVTDSSGNLLKSGSVNVPDGGWWVIGLNQLPEAVPPPINPPPPVTPIPDPPASPPPPTPTGNPAATPEPGTLAMAALGSGAICAWRRVRKTV